MTETAVWRRDWKKDTGSGSWLDTEVEKRTELAECLVGHRFTTSVTPATTAALALPVLPLWQAQSHIVNPRDLTTLAANAIEAPARTESFAGSRHRCKNCADELFGGSQRLWELDDTITIRQLAQPTDDLSDHALQADFLVSRAVARVDERFDQPSPEAAELARVVVVTALAADHRPLDAGWSEDGLAVEFAEGTRRVTVECLNDGGVAVMLRNTAPVRWQTLDYDGLRAADEAVAAAVAYLDRSRVAFAG